MEIELIKGANGWKNYGEELKRFADKQCEGSMTMSKGENTDSVQDEEEHIKMNCKRK